MAHKLLAPFKKFPQQLPIFKKSEKEKDISFNNYNSVCGMLDDVTSQSFDDSLHLLAIGTKKGEIKIYGSEGVVFTLIGNPLKSVNFLKFLVGQGRLLSVNCDNNIVLWEFKAELSNWEVTSTISFGSIISNSNITTFDVSHPFSWKSDNDNLLQVLIVGISNNTIRQILIVGNQFHVYDGDDLHFDCDGIFEICQDLIKEYEFGEIMSIKFNSLNNEKFLVSFSKGLLLSMHINIIDPKTVTEDIITEKPIDEPKVEKVEEMKEAEIVEQQNDDSHNDAIIDENGVVESETDKSKNNNEIPNTEDIKVEVKVELKKIKESVQVSFATVKKPLILNYVVKDKKINSVCWSDNDIVVNYDESNDICFYTETDGDIKLVASHTFASIEEEISTIYHLSCFEKKGDKVFVYISKTEERSNLLRIFTSNGIDAEFETPSTIFDYVVVSDEVKDENSNRTARALLILCESELIAIDLTSEHYSEIQCPYLVFPINSQVTAVSGIVQVPHTLFSNHKTTKDVFQNWPLNTPLLSNKDAAIEDNLNILATGHSDGDITIWQILPSGVILSLVSIKNIDLFRNVSPLSSNSINRENSSTRRKVVGHHLINVDDTLLRINNIQLILNSTGSSTDLEANEMYCVVGNSSGVVFVLKFNSKSESDNNLMVITSHIKDCHDKEDIIWNDSDAPELLDSSEITCHIPNLCHIIKLNPSLPITALAYKPQWHILAIGSTYGFVLVDLKQNKTVFSYSTFVRASKNNVIPPPLTVGQQIKKSMRQSFRKFKKLKPSSKHTYTVNGDKSKDKENKPEVKPEDGEQIVKETEAISDQGETIPEKADEEDKEKVDDTVKSASFDETNTEMPAEEVEPPIEISRKDKPSGSVGSLLIETTNLVSVIKEPCLFVGTNIGAIYAFELKFGLDGPIVVTLSKELHLQHKAPVLFMGIVNSNHVPLICSNEINPYQRKWSVVEDKTEDKSEEINGISATELELGPSGDADNQEIKLKAGTLPAPPKSNEEGAGKVEPARKSVDAGKDKSISPNTTMKKSGTLPASFLQAIGKTPGNADSHELLVVSEEQVKLFSLPSLKAKYKYKVVDTGHHFGHVKTNNIPEHEVNSQDKKQENVESNNIDEQTSKKATRRISTVGLSKVHGSKQTSNKWNVSIALTNGEIIALTLNNLKKYLSNIYNGSSPILSSLSNGETNLVVSFSNQHNMQITDFSHSGSHYFEPLVTISIPETARPITKVEDKPDEETKVEQPIEEIITVEEKNETVLTNGDASEHMNGHVETLEIDEEKDQLGDETVVQNPSTTNHGDVTMDSIKEYITNMDGNVTVKTFESSTEKHITVNDGHIVTTVHERQLKDGEVIKDDTIKITSDTVGNSAITLNG